MSDDSLHIAAPDEARRESGAWGIWLGGTLLAGLLLTPLFHALPPRWKLLGLNSWILAAVVGYASGTLSKQLPGRAVSGRRLFAAITAIGCVVLLSVWGLRDLREVTLRRLPPLPIGRTSSAEQLAGTLEAQSAIRAMMIPTMDDYQRMRFHQIRAFTRIRPWAIWLGELTIASLIAGWAFGVGCTDSSRPSSDLKSDSDSLEQLSAK